MNDMTPFEEIPQKLKEIGENLAEYTAKYEFLDDMTKVELSRLAAKHEGSEATRQRLAYAELVFSNHLEAKRTARHEMLKYRAYFEAMQARQDWYRSMNSLRKAEMQL